MSFGWLIEPEGKSHRPAIWSELKKVVAEFDRIRSFETTKYRNNSRNLSYILAMIRDIDAKPGGLGWTDVEIEASVGAYFEMLEKQRSGIAYSKTEFNQRLRSGLLAARTRSSIELRMQNISAIVHEDGGEWLHGYPPARHVGAGVACRIRKAVNSLGFTPKSKPELPSAPLEAKVRRMRKTVMSAPPPGQVKPEHVQTTVDQTKRDPEVKAWVLQVGAGVCELCGGPAPFVDRYGLPFLEMHHVRFLADGGSDRVSNAVALCPNCHRACHQSADQEALRETLYHKIARLEPE